MEIAFSPYPLNLSLAFIHHLGYAVQYDPVSAMNDPTGVNIIMRSAGPYCSVPTVGGEDAQGLEAHQNPSPRYQHPRNHEVIERTSELRIVQEGQQRLHPMTHRVLCRDPLNIIAAVDLHIFNMQIEILRLHQARRHVTVLDVDSFDGPPSVGPKTALAVSDANTAGNVGDHVQQLHPTFL